jgi:hypothetical protein
LEDAVPMVLAGGSSLLSSFFFFAAATMMIPALYDLKCLEVLTPAFAGVRTSVR